MAAQPKTPEALARKLSGLRPFPKGVSGHPGGRPAKKPITEAYAEAIKIKLPAELRKVKIGKTEVELKPGATMAHLMALGQCIAAAKGDAAPAQEIANRLEGKVPVPVEVSGTDLIESLTIEELEVYAATGELPELEEINPEREPDSG